MCKDGKRLNLKNENIETKELNNFQKSRFLKVKHSFLGLQNN